MLNMGLLSEVTEKLTTKEKERIRPSVKIFKYITSSIWASFSFVGLVLIMLYFLSKGGYSAVDPIYMYIIGFFLIILFVVRGTDPRKLKETLGLTSYAPGMNIIMIFLGLGVGITLYSWFTAPAMEIFAGNDFLMSLVRPLYVPYATAESSFFFSEALMDAILFYIIVAVFEEFYRILTFKNFSNWLSKKGIGYNYAMLGGLALSVVAWYLLHFFSWGSLNLFSLGFIFVFGLLFYSTYLIPSFLGLIGKKSIQIRNLVITGSISAHYSWDLLIAVGFSGFGLTSLQFKVIGPTLIILSLLSFYLIKYYFSRKYIGSDSI